MTESKFSLYFVLCGLGLLGLTGCLATAQLQEPAALPPGEWEVSFGAGGIGVLEESEDVEGDGSKEDGILLSDLAIPSGQIGLRVGLVEGLEGYGVLGWPNGLLLGAKYQAVGNYGSEGFALSFSLDTNVTPLIFGTDSGDLFDTSFAIVNARTYLGWTLKNNASVFVAPGANGFYRWEEGEGSVLPALALGGRSAKFPALGGDLQLCGEIAGAYAEGGVLWNAMIGVAF